MKIDVYESCMEKWQGKLKMKLFALFSLMLKYHNISSAVYFLTILIEFVQTLVYTLAFHASIFPNSSFASTLVQISLIFQVKLYINYLIV